MKEKEIRLFYSEYQDIEDLPLKEKNLVKEAFRAAEQAYAPYSHFQVGAAIMLDDGTIVSGANVENAAFPSGTCAEKTALSYAVTNFPGKRPLSIAIAGLANGRKTPEPLPPCGNCRQILLEEENRQDKPIRVILAGEKRVLVLNSASYLMPLQFTNKNLNPDS